MFTSAEKLYVCCIKTREWEKGGERGERDRLEAGKNIPVTLNFL